MPQIIVTADRGAAFEDGAVTFRERVTVADFESDHFGKQLVERLGWAVGDADAVERVDEPTEPTHDAVERVDEPTEPTHDAGDPGRVSVPSPA